MITKSDIAMLIAGILFAIGLSLALHPTVRKSAPMPYAYGN